jgi:hypothetical protein
MSISVSNMIGVSLEYTDSSPSFNLGTVVNLDDGGQAVYVRAASEVPTYAAVAVQLDDTVVPLTTTNAAGSKTVGFAQVSIAPLYYGWVQLGGKPRVLVAANCQPNVPLYTTATAGVLDDTVVSGCLVAGLVAKTSTVTASNVACIAGYPHILTGAAG